MKKNKCIALLYITVILLNFNLFSQTRLSEETPGLLYSTYLGGSKNDGINNWLNEFAIDTSGNIIFTIDTESPDFPTTDNAFDKTYNSGNNWGNEDNLLLCFNTEENKLKYSSYFGGKNGPDFNRQVCIHNNCIYLTGNTGSSDFPVTSNGFDNTFNGPVFRHADGVISKFKNNELVYSTFIGTSGNEFLSKVLLDKDGNIISVGQIAKPNDFLIVHKYSEETLNDNPNGCIIKFNSSGDSILSSILLGPVWEIDAVIDDEGYIYVTGTTPSPNFPVTESVYDNGHNGGARSSGGDIFICKISPMCDELLFSTFLGGAGDENYPRIQLDKSKNIIIYGRTRSGNFPLTQDALDQELSGTSDLFISKLSNDGTTLLYSSFFGGSEVVQNGELNGNIIAADNGDIFICGTTSTNDHPVTQNALFNSNSGGSDIFITVFDNTLRNIKYSTYFGGKSNESNPVINIDSKGNLVGICATESSDFPVTQGSLMMEKNGGSDIGVFKLSSLYNSQTNIDKRRQIPHGIQLNQNYPNPFNPSTTIIYQLANENNVKLIIHNILGEEIKTLFDCFQSAGKYSVSWDGRDKNDHLVCSGVYIYKLEAEKGILQKKMVLAK